MTVSEAFTRYTLEVITLGGQSLKTKQNYQTICNSFIKGVGDVPIVLIDDNYLITWKIYMTNIGNATSSIASSLCAFRNVLKYCSSKGAEVMDYRDVTLPKIVSKAPTF